MDLRQLYRLNPGYRRWATHPEPEGPHHLLLPISQAHRLEKAQTEIASGINWTRYRVQSGDALSILAEKSQTTISHLMQKNRLSSTQLRANTWLLLPKPLAPKIVYQLATRHCLHHTCEQAAPLLHTVRYGDSLWKIGRQYGISIDRLAAFNGLDPQKPLQPGQVLKIFMPA